MGGANQCGHSAGNGAGWIAQQVNFDLILNTAGNIIKHATALVSWFADIKGMEIEAFYD